jgi:hypothetical protein
MSFWADSGSFQRPGSSDFAFSSARRRVAASTSKMPPQQSDGLLDRLDQLFGFSAHDFGPELSLALGERLAPAGP